MEIFIIRHGETRENRDRIIQGWLPGQLTEGGERQVKELGLQLLKYAPFDQIISSDLERAKETAGLISKAIPPCPICYEKRLRERCYGSLEGQSIFRLKRLLVENKTDLRGLQIPHGENYEVFERRAADYFRELTAGTPDRKIILVTHAGVIQVILQRILGISWRDTGNGEGFRISLTAQQGPKIHPL